MGRGQYAHLGLKLLDGKVIVGGPSQPLPSAGKWSDRNARGWDRPRPDLPKVPKTYVFETPNFGDAATYGSHMHVWQREIRQHQLFEAQGMLIEPTILAAQAADHVLVKFALTPSLSRRQPEFELMLLWSLNVLQENTGVAGIFPSDATREDFVGTIRLDWEVFPPGTIDEIVAWFSSRPSMGTSSPDFEKHLRDRATAFNKLTPTAYLRDSGQFGSYVGAKFADDLVVFENLNYGNALYVLYDDWTEISKRSRLDLLRDHDAKFDRIIHTDDWQLRFTKLIKRELADRRRGRGRASALGRLK